MRKFLRAGAVIATLSLLSGNAFAAQQAACAKSQDMAALQTAAIQQRLMVAALSCNAIGLYNQFVSAYQKDLYASDKALQSFFRRLNKRSGTADYHAYKTRLANSLSMTSIGDMAAYCNNSKATFDMALGAAKATFAGFLASQNLALDATYETCAEPLNLASKAVAPANAPVPMAKPVDAVIPAQGGGLAALTPVSASGASPVITAPSSAPATPLAAKPVLNLAPPALAPAITN